MTPRATSRGPLSPPIASTAIRMSCFASPMGEINPGPAGSRPEHQTPAAPCICLCWGLHDAAAYTLRESQSSELSPDDASIYSACGVCVCADWNDDVLGAA